MGEPAPPGGGRVPEITRRGNAFRKWFGSGCVAEPEVETREAALERALVDVWDWWLDLKPWFTVEERAQEIARLIERSGDVT